MCHLLLLFVNSFQFQRTKTVFEKYTWLVYNRDDNLCIVKSVQYFENYRSLSAFIAF